MAFYRSFSPGGETEDRFFSLRIIVTNIFGFFFWCAKGFWGCGLIIAQQDSGMTAIASPLLSQGSFVNRGKIKLKAYFWGAILEQQE